MLWFELMAAVTTFDFIVESKLQLVILGRPFQAACTWASCERFPEDSRLDVWPYAVQRMFGFAVRESS
jgi:hypothetical protein